MGKFDYELFTFCTDRADAKNKIREFFKSHRFNKSIKLVEFNDSTYARVFVSNEFAQRKLTEFIFKNKTFALSPRFSIYDVVNRMPDDYVSINGYRNPYMKKLIRHLFDRFEIDTSNNIFSLFTWEKQECLSLPIDKSNIILYFPIEAIGIETERSKEYEIYKSK